MNYTLITGASKGIGKALAYECAKRGMNLLLIARSQDLLEEIKQNIKEKYQVDVKTLVSDLTEKGAAKEIFDWSLLNNISVDVLINNAGFGIWGTFEEQPLEEQLQMISLNQNVLLELTYYFIPVLKKSSRSHILNVSSTAAFQPTPYFSAYAATKAFVLYFSRSLREELEGTNVHVNCLCPGPTESYFYERAGFNNTLNSASIKMSAEEVAISAINGIYNDKPLIVPGLSNKVGMILSRLTPTGIMVKILRHLFKPEKEIPNVKVKETV